MFSDEPLCSLSSKGGHLRYHGLRGILRDAFLLTWSRFNEQSTRAHKLHPYFCSKRCDLPQPYFLCLSSLFIHSANCTMKAYSPRDSSSSSSSSSSNNNNNNHPTNIRDSLLRQPHQDQRGEGSDDGTHAAGESSSVPASAEDATAMTASRMTTLRRIIREALCLVEDDLSEGMLAGNSLSSASSSSSYSSSDRSS